MGNSIGVEVGHEQDVSNRTALLWRSALSGRKVADLLNKEEQMAIVATCIEFPRGEEAG